MTLMELMTALAILGLAAALAFSNLGPWLALSRASADEAAFWRANAPTQLLLSELAAGAIDPGQRQIGERELRFRALVPRLSLTPINVSLSIISESAGDRLVFRATQFAHESVLFAEAAPMRFARQGQGAVLLETRHSESWLPLATLTFAADAPFTCDFDPIPRTCR